MRRKLIPYLIGIALALSLAGVVVAQISTSFDLRWSLLGGGGGTRQSTSFRLDDSLGQWAVGTASSSSARLQGGFWYGVAFATPTRTPTPSRTDTRTPTRTYTPSPTGSPTRTPTRTITPTRTVTWTPTATRTATKSPTPTFPPGDAYEPDNSCTAARAITPGGTLQTHTFHIPGDQDWVKFTASANRTFMFEVSDPDPQADPVVFLYDKCNQPPKSGQDNAFGQTLQLEWDGAAGTTYYLKLQQRDPSVAGNNTHYDMSVSVDVAQPAAPVGLRCASLNPTTLSFQWHESPETDVVAYEVHYQEQGGGLSGASPVNGKGTTYYLQNDLHTDKWYDLWVRAKDYSNNTSDESAKIACKPHQPQDTTAPEISVQQPTDATTYTTTMSSITLSGLATDETNNLSRVRVQNVTRSLEAWDYSLQGGSHEFRVENLDLGPVDNQIDITAYDDAGNPSPTYSMRVKRVAQSLGTVIIVAGHNEDFGLQTNIDSGANRAYRVFRGAGIIPGNIYYLASSPQDPNGDGKSEVDGPPTRDNLTQAIEVWAAQRVDANNPLYLYMMDHGILEAFCTDGCDTNPADPKATTATDLDTMLTHLEGSKPGVQINVIIEACRSGSFIDRQNVTDSISKNGRVVITSTDRDHNAYASAQGAYFSDLFFTCIASSNDLRTCFTQARSAVTVMPNGQSPWLDDNGDGRFDGTDGTQAAQRYVARFFGAAPPRITAANVAVAGTSGTLTAQVQVGSAKIDAVWAAIYRPSFQEPSQVTLDLGVPLVRLDPDPSEEGLYRTVYPNGFAESGQYQIIFYARDKSDDYAQPALVTVGEQPNKKTYFPTILH